MENLSERVEKSDRFYLVHKEKQKFWEVSNLGNLNRFRYGKWDRGKEKKVVDGTRVYSDIDQALNRALEIILMKTDKGYDIVKKDNLEKARVVNGFTNLMNRVVEKENIEIDLE